MKNSVKLLSVFSLVFFFLVSGVASPKKQSREFLKKINPAVVLISSGVGYGMGVVIDKDRVLTSEHVVYESGKRPEIKVNFFPDFREAEGRLLKFSSKQGSYQLALIEIDTGDIKPMTLADGVAIGEMLFWYRPGKIEHPRLVTNRGKLINKNSRIIWFTDIVYEKNKVPEGQELVLIATGEAPAASSGGPVWNKYHQLVGIVLMRECEGCDVSKFISIDGICRFLTEKE